MMDNDIKICVRISDEARSLIDETSILSGLSDADIVRKLMRRFARQANVINLCDIKNKKSRISLRIPCGLNSLIIDKYNIGDIIETMSRIILPEKIEKLKQQNNIGFCTDKIEGVDYNVVDCP